MFKSMKFRALCMVMRGYGESPNHGHVAPKAEDGVLVTTCYDKLGVPAAISRVELGGCKYPVMDVRLVEVADHGSFLVLTLRQIGRQESFDLYTDISVKVRTVDEIETQRLSAVKLIENERRRHRE
jgi:hypothetical protein